MKHWSRFHFLLGLIGSLYVLLIIALLAADLLHTSPGRIWEALTSREIRGSIRLSLLSSGISTIFAMWIAVPLGYFLARVPFRGRALVETIVDIPIVLPPLIVGLSLLILFQSSLGRAFQQVAPVTYRIPAVILAQFAVVTAFAVRTMRDTFSQITPRAEHVAMTLGCTPSQAFWHVALPEAKRGLIAAATLSWARAIGEFGPVLVFAGITRMRTEVMPSTVFLELSQNRMDAALAVSLLMVAIAAIVLLVARRIGATTGVYR